MIQKIRTTFLTGLLLCGLLVALQAQIPTKYEYGVVSYYGGAGNTYNLVSSLNGEIKTEKGKLTSNDASLNFLPVNKLLGDLSELRWEVYSTTTLAPVHYFYLRRSK